VRSELRTDPLAESLPAASVDLSTRTGRRRRRRGESGIGKVRGTVSPAD